MDVPTSAGAAARHHHALFVMRKIGYKLARSFLFVKVFAHHGSHRHLENEVFPVGAVHARAFAVRSAFGLEMVLETIFYQRGQTGVGRNDHVSPTTAVAAVRAAFRNMGLAAKRHTAGSAVAALDVYAHFINEQQNLFPMRFRSKQLAVSDLPQ